MTLEFSGCPFLSESPGSYWLLHKTGPSACPRSQTPVPLMMPPQGIHLSSFASEQLQLCAGQCVLSHILQKTTATELTRENSPFIFKDITRKLGQCILENKWLKFHETKPCDVNWVHAGIYFSKLYICLDVFSCLNQTII